MNSKTVCIKLVTGEDLFAELIHDENIERDNLIKLYQPFEATIVRSARGTSIALNPWQVFTDDLTYYLPAAHVVSINSLDRQHSQIYGSLVSNVEMKFIQNEIAEAAKSGSITSKQIESALKETLGVLMKAGIKYQINLPELDQVKHDFYVFLMGQYPNNVEVKH